MTDMTNWNADDWHLLLSQYLDNRATQLNGLATVSLMIADCMDALRAPSKPIPDFECCSSSREILNRRMESLTPPKVRQWLSERLANCYRIAATKTGADRDGWLDDAAYFAAAMGMVEWSELERQELFLASGLTNT